MSKKNKTPKNPVSIVSSKSPVGLKKGILRPLTQAFKDQAGQVRPGEKLNEGALNEFKDQIKKLAADGTLDASDLQKLQSFQTSERGKHFEPTLRNEALQQAITNSQYGAQVQSQSQGFRDFRSQQSNVISQALRSQMSQLSTFLGSMQADADSALGGFLQDLTQAQARTSQQTQRQLASFERGNRKSERTIDRLQSNIAKLPKPPKPTKQISDKITGVDSVDPFEKIGVNRAPIQVQSAPAMTGFSQAQQESQARQMQGLTGFRSRRA